LSRRFHRFLMHIRALRPDLQAFCLLLLAWVAVPNLPFWLLNHFYVDVPRGSVNLELFLLSLVLMGRRWGFWYLIGAGTILMLLILVDFASWSAYVFYFSLGDVVSAAKFVVLLPASRTIPIALCMLFIAAGLATAVLFFSSKAVARSSTLLRTGLALVCLVLLVIHVDRTRKRVPILPPSVSERASIRYPTFSFYKAIREFESEGNSPVAPGSVASAAESFQESRGQHNLVLILSESFGLPASDEASYLPLAMLQTPALQQRYEIATIRVPFEGSTVPAEFRELCGTRQRFRLSQIERMDFASCLPHTLKAKGMVTTGVHGFTGLFFQRLVWYPRLGFDRILFADDLQRSGLTEACRGAFEGACDTQISGWLGDQLVRGSIG
jgi:hypothetical protein